MFLNHGDLTALVINDVRDELRRAPRPAYGLRDELRRALHLHAHREVRVRAGPSTAPPGGDGSSAPVAIEAQARKGQPCSRTHAVRVAPWPASDSNPIPVLAHAGA